MRKYIYIVTILVISFSCSQQQEYNRQSIQESIDQMEAKLYNGEDAQVNMGDAVGLINLYQKFAKEYPKDSLAPIFLFRASDLSMNLNRPVQTISLFNDLLDKYPEYEKVPSVLFLKAFVYEDQLKDLDKAKMYYEEFLEKYPDSDFADDAEISLINLGKTPEELILEFEKNQK